MKHTLLITMTWQVNGKVVPAPPTISSVILSLYQTAFWWITLRHFPGSIFYNFPMKIYQVLVHWLGIRNFDTDRRASLNVFKILIKIRWYTRGVETADKEKEDSFLEYLVIISPYIFHHKKRSAKFYFPHKIHEIQNIFLNVNTK